VLSQPLQVCIHAVTLPTIMISTASLLCPCPVRPHASLLTAIVCCCQRSATATAANDVTTSHYGGHGRPKPLAGYVYEVLFNRPLQRLPGATLLLPKAPVTSTRITLAPVTYRVSGHI
jgi:hypothetical protein